MTSNELKWVGRRDFILAVSLIAGGLAVMGVSLMQFAIHVGPQFAQATQQTAPSAVQAGKDNGPAESKPGGVRPTTPTPEPARPDAEARKAGAVPALPPAPAEKTAPPINRK
jgi:hypothetical protein